MSQLDLFLGILYDNNNTLQKKKKDLANIFLSLNTLPDTLMHLFDGTMWDNFDIQTIRNEWKLTTCFNLNCKDSSLVIQVNTRVYITT